jgi:hypothetical protein
VPAGAKLWPAGFPDPPHNAANGIVNAAAIDFEHDLRSAAEILNEMDKPIPLISKLMSELSKIANACPDASTDRRLRRLLGEAS